MHQRLRNRLTRRPKLAGEAHTYAAVPPTQKRWPRTRVFFRRLFISLGVVTFFCLLVTLIIMLGTNAQAPLPGKFILAMKIDGDWPEYRPVDNPFAEGSPAFIDVINSIDHAAADDRVRALVIDLESSNLGVGHIQELRSAILRFRATKKPTYIYAPSYGEPGRGLGLYYFVSAFDQIWMQPVGVLSISGIWMEMPYARALLDKYGVQPAFFQRKEYKSLFETFNNEHMSPASHQEMSGLVNDLAGQFMAGIEQSKHVTAPALKKLVDQGIFTDQEAVTAGLVATLGGYEQMKVAAAEEVLGHKPAGVKKLDKLATATKTQEKSVLNGKNFVDLDRYASYISSDHPSRHKTVALIYITGTIEDAGESSSAPPDLFRAGLGDSFKPAQNPTDALVSAGDDPSIKAIILRIDSPGGSPSAAETIRRAVVRAETKGKKVTVSMGDECASGGYWIAAAGNHIFADPGTLTGSIGVAGGKFVLAGVWKKLGINWEGVGVGQNVDMYSFNHPFTASETARVNDMMDAIYSAFVARVAEGRHMTIAEAEEVARGRVWTGAQGKQNGLVDDLGGLDAALDYTAKQLGQKDRAHLNIETYPKPQSPLDKIETLFGEASLIAPLNAQLPPELQQLGAAALASRYATYSPVIIH